MAKYCLSKFFTLLFCIINKKKLEKPSKRMTCRKRHKIEKKVREHNKKLKKEQKKKDALGKFL